jgi:hypothetical protein
VQRYDLNRPEAKRFRVKLANLNIPKIDLVEVFVDLLEAEYLKSKSLANEDPALMPAWAAPVRLIIFGFPSHRNHG